MPQMSPLLWGFMIVYTIILLLVISSFLYFMTTPTLSPPSSHTPMHTSPRTMFNWLW